MDRISNSVRTQYFAKRKWYKVNGRIKAVLLIVILNGMGTKLGFLKERSKNFVIHKQGQYRAPHIV
jgi:hypothetical protein